MNQNIVPLIAMAIYTLQAIIMLQKREYGFSLMWFAYGLANIGILIAQRR